MKKLVLSSLLLCLCTLCISQDYPKPTNVATPAEKVYGLSKFWMEARYNFIFMEKIGVQKWDSTYQAFLPLVMNTSNDWEYWRLLQKFCAVLKDGHTTIWRPSIKLSQKEPEKAGQVFIPERTGLFTEGNIHIGEIARKPYIMAVDKNLAKRLPVLSEITEVNHIPVEQYITEYVEPYVSESTDHIRRASSIKQIATGLYGEKLHLTFKKPDGEKSAIELTYGRTDNNFPEGFDMAVSPAEGEDKLFFMKRQADDMVYISLNSFNDPQIVEEFKAALPEIRKAKSLIIDIRRNTGGNSGTAAEILQYFTPDSILIGSKSRTRQNLSSFRAWGAGFSAADTAHGEWATRAYRAANDKLYYDLGSGMSRKVSLSPDERIIVPTVILTDYYTGSAAEDFLIYADNQKHIKRIGRKTFGSTGQPIFITLGKGFSARICTKEDTYPDGRPFIGFGVIPHIEVEPTVDDYKNGKDVILDKAVEYLKGEITAVK